MLIENCYDQINITSQHHLILPELLSPELIKTKPNNKTINIKLLIRIYSKIKTLTTVINYSKSLIDVLQYLSIII